jgi:hypothetical protein
MTMFLEPIIEPHTRIVIDEASIRDLGVLQEVNRCFLHPLGLALASCEDGTFAIVVDTDPEGTVFAKLPPDEVARKAQSVAMIRQSIEGPRMAKCGWLIQPLEACSTPEGFSAPEPPTT